MAVPDREAFSPAVTLAARSNKSRKLEVQPRPADVTTALRDHLNGNPLLAPGGINRHRLTRFRGCERIGVTCSKR